MTQRDRPDSAPSKEGAYDQVETARELYRLLRENERAYVSDAEPGCAELTYIDGPYDLIHIAAALIEFLATTNEGPD